MNEITSNVFSLLTVSNTASDGEDGFDTCDYTIGEDEKSLSDWITYLQGNFNAMYAISQSVMQVFKNGEVFIETKDWAQDSIFTDNVSINVDSREFSNWLSKISN